VVRVLLVAHRTPATRAACERLATAGAQLFEADVQIDAQDRVVVSHYLQFGRFLHRDNWRVRWHTGRIRDPQLADVNGVVPAGCRVLLDLKESRPERRARLVAALIETLADRDRFRICGHLSDDLDELREAGFRTWRTARDPSELAGLLADGALPDEAVSIRHSLLSPRLVEQLHDRVPSIVAWTVNGLNRARQLQAMGVDGVTTDRAAILAAMSTAAN
jgi:glycerophosphoryl diester phosphodiesterase